MFADKTVFTENNKAVAGQESNVWYSCYGSQVLPTDPCKLHTTTIVI